MTNEPVKPGLVVQSQSPEDYPDAVVVETDGKTVDPKTQPKTEKEGK